MSKHNGWTNFETWKVNLEVFDGLTPEDITGWDLVTAGDLREQVEAIIYDDCDASDIVRGWALNFISEVNFQEIADAINER